MGILSEAQGDHSVTGNVSPSGSSMKKLAFLDEHYVKRTEYQLLNPFML